MSPAETLQVARAMVSDLNARSLRVKLKGIITVTQKVIDISASKVDTITNIAILKPEQMLILIAQSECTG